MLKRYPRLFFLDEKDGGGSNSNEANNLDGNGNNNPNPVEQEKAQRESMFNARTENANKKKVSEMQAEIEELKSGMTTLLERNQSIQDNESNKSKGGRPAGDDTKMDQLMDLFNTKMSDFQKTFTERLDVMEKRDVESRKQENRANILRDINVDPKFLRLIEDGIVQVPDSYFEHGSFERLDNLISSMDGYGRGTNGHAETAASTDNAGNTVPKINVPHQATTDQGASNVQRDTRQKTGVSETIDAASQRMDEILGEAGASDNEFGVKNVTKDMTELFTLAETIGELQAGG